MNKKSPPMVSGSPVEPADTGNMPPIKMTKKIMNRRLNKGLPTNQALKPNSNKTSTFKKPGFQAGGLMQQVSGGPPASPNHVINVNVHSGPPAHPAIIRKLQTVKKK